MIVRPLTVRSAAKLTRYSPFDAVDGDSAVIWLREAAERDRAVPRRPSTSGVGAIT
jgi:hypothetical protein